MKTIEKIAAEILVQSGYAESWAINGNDDLVIGWIVSSDFDGSKWDAVDPFADTLEGRRQLDALFFYTLFPDKSITFTGDGHFNTREQMIHYVEDYLNEY